MGNKTQLQLNNETLASILSNVLGLPSQESLKHGAYVWKKLTAEGGDFIDFVVSDSETTYPDGGTQGGYWYEKVIDGLPLEALGCTKFAIDKSIFSTKASITTYLPHSLGMIPTRAFLLTNDAFTPVDSNYKAILSFDGRIDPYYKQQFYGLTGVLQGSSFDMKMGSGVSVNANSIRINYSYSSAGDYYQPGIEYTLITMA